jgi:hypothetical protein
MTLTPKNCICSNAGDFYLRGRYHRIIAKFSLAMMHLYFLLLVFPQVAAGQSPTPTNSPTCSENVKSEGIPPLINNYQQVSAWLREPRMGIGDLIQKFIPQSSINSSESNLSQFDSIITRSIIPLQVSSIEKPLSLYTQAWRQTVLPFFNMDFTFTNPVEMNQPTIDKIPLILISGGKPITIHADSRYQVPEILAKSGTNAIAAVDGTFFSLKYLTSNTMIGPILSQVNNQFIPGNNSENKKLTNRPLVLISPRAIKYMPFDPDKHNTLPGIQAEMPNVTDAFVAGAFLVRDGQPAPPESFKSLYGADVARHRAFWGFNNGVPTIGVSTKPVDSANLAIILTKAGLQEAVMLDSGASTSLAYQGKSVVGYVPRPVPHVVALIPPPGSNTGCTPASP